MATNGTGEVIRFGLFEVDLKSGELRRSGRKVRLQQLPFRLLAVLLSQPNEVVTREELRARLWPSDTFVDFDHGLNAAVRRLRDALGDTAENPRFIETLARRGYRFIAPVQAAVGSRPEAAFPTLISGALRSNAHGWPMFAAIAVFLTGGIVAGWHAGHRSAAASLRPVETRLTGNPENDPIWGAALSPDGKYLAFSDRAGLLLREVATGETHPIALHDDLRTGPLSWFPNGSHLLAVRAGSKGERPGLWNISVFGGEPHQLLEGVEACPAVSPDGSQILFVRGEYNHQEIWAADADGEHARKVFGEPGDNFYSAVWSADGKRIAFAHESGRLKYDWFDGGGSLGIYDLSTRKASYLLSSSRLRSGLAWLPDGRLIYSLAELPPNQNDANLWAVPIDASGMRASGPASRLTSGPQNKVCLSASADGKKLNFLRRSSAPIISVAEIRGDGNELGALQRLSLGEGNNYPYTWTPDGQALLFTSDRDGRFHLFRQAPGEPAPELLVNGNSPVRVTRLSADLKQILYIEDPAPGDADHRTRLMRIPLDGGTPQLVLAEAGISNFQCARAPAKTCLFGEFSSNHLDFFTFDPMTGEHQLLTQFEDPESNLYNWTLAPDGSQIAMAKKRRIQGGATVRLFPLDGTREREISMPDWPSIAFLDFAADGRSLWVDAVSGAGEQHLLRVDLHGKAVSVLQEREKELGWAIPSLDGKRLAIWEGTASSNAWLLQSF